MESPKYHTGQKVEARVNDSEHSEFVTATIEDVRMQLVYQEFPHDSYQRSEDQIRLPRPTEEEAWEKAAMVIGRRGYLRLDYSSEAEDFDRETRHQVYKILVTAGVKITDEVKDRVRKLIVLDNNL